MDATTEQLYTKIAKMMVYEVPQHEIARAVGVSESRISQIKSCADFQSILQRLSFDQLHKMHTLNGGWDLVEELSINQVIEVLSSTADPEFALRAAMMANKANRRGTQHNRPINGGGTVQASLSLNINFVNRLRNESTLEVETTPADLAQKAEDFLPVDKVKNVLKLANKQRDATLDAFVPDLLEGVTL